MVVGSTVGEGGHLYFRLWKLFGGLGVVRAPLGGRGNVGSVVGM